MQKSILLVWKKYHSRDLFFNLLIVNVEIKYVYLRIKFLKDNGFKL